MKRIYLIGAVTGRRGDNRAKFEAARSELLRTGYECDIPHDFIEKGTEWDMAMCISLNHLTRYSWWGGYHRDYDAVGMLDDWEESRGARIEHDLCEAIGIPCVPWRELLEGGVMHG